MGRKEVVGRSPELEDFSGVFSEAEADARLDAVRAFDDAVARGLDQKLAEKIAVAAAEKWYGKRQVDKRTARAAALHALADHERIGKVKIKKPMKPKDVELERTFRALLEGSGQSVENFMKNRGLFGVQTKKGKLQRMSARRLAMANKDRAGLGVDEMERSLEYLRRNPRSLQKFARKTQAEQLDRIKEAAVGTRVDSVPDSKGRLNRDNFKNKSTQLRRRLLQQEKMMRAREGAEVDANEVRLLASPGDEKAQAAMTRAVEEDRRHKEALKESIPQRQARLAAEKAEKAEFERQMKEARSRARGQQEEGKARGEAPSAARPAGEGPGEGGSKDSTRRSERKGGVSGWFEKQVKRAKWAGTAPLTKEEFGADVVRGQVASVKADLRAKREKIAAAAARARLAKEEAVGVVKEAAKNLWQSQSVTKDVTFVGRILLKTPGIIPVVVFAWLILSTAAMVYSYATEPATVGGAPAVYGMYAAYAGVAAFTNYHLILLNAVVYGVDAMFKVLILGVVEMVAVVLQKMLTGLYSSIDSMLASIPGLEGELAPPVFDALVVAPGPSFSFEYIYPIAMTECTEPLLPMFGGYATMDCGAILRAGKLTAEGHRFVASPGGWKVPLHLTGTPAAVVDGVKAVGEWLGHGVEASVHYAKVGLEWGIGEVKRLWGVVFK